MASKRTSELTTHDMHNLDAACRLISRAFGPPYLVGSMGIGGGGTGRDVDVRLILSDEEFDHFFAAAIYGTGRLRWELLSLAIGDYLRQRTGLPIDFQIQRQTEANERHDKPRNPLGMGRSFAGGGDATPWHGDGDARDLSAENPSSRGQV